MENKSGTPPKLVHLIVPSITAFITLLVALVGLGTAIIQAVRTAQAGQTAQTALSSSQASGATITPQTALNPIETSALSAVASNTSASISISNKLMLPVNIYVGNSLQGVVKSNSVQAFIFDKYPVSVTWNVVKQTTVKGVPLGHDMGGTFDDVNLGDDISIDNVIADQSYFYPVIDNHTDTDCLVTINKGWQSEFITGASAPAHSDNIGFGYYELYTNSNVTLDCGGKLYWWGQQPDETNGTSFFDQVTTDTGYIDFTLNPE
jgi:hypothetical protein